MADEIYLGEEWYISTTPQNSDLTKIQFDAVTWERIFQVVSGPATGEETNFVSQVYTDTGRTSHKKGVVSGVASPFTVGYDAADEGQSVLTAASGSRLAYAFKHVLTDSPNTATTTNTIEYFRALVGAWQRESGEVEGYVNRIYPLQITKQAPIVVPPEAI